jgi:hypothetical protein
MGPAVCRWGFPLRDDAFVSPLVFVSEPFGRCALHRYARAMSGSASGTRRVLDRVVKAVRASNASCFLALVSMRLLRPVHASTIPPRSGRQSAMR